MSAETTVPLFYGMILLASVALWPIVFRSRIRLAGVGAASLLAGPVFAGCAEIPFLLLSLLTSHPYPSVNAIAFLLILAAVIIIGALIALPASLICTAAMIRIGDHLFWTRHPLAWALAGAVVAPTPFIASGLVVENNAGLVFAFATTGACCALVCRRGIRWRPIQGR